VARLRTLCTLVAAVLGVAPSVAHAAGCGVASSAEPTKEALASYEAAVAQSKEGKYREALAGFRRAHELSPSWVILFNIGKAASLSAEPVQAIEAYRCHLELGGDEVDPVRRSEVLAEIEKLRGEVGLLVIEVDDPGAAVFVDERQVGVAPLPEPILVNPGSRLLRAKGPRIQSTRAVEVPRGGRLVVRFEAPVTTPTEAPFRFPSGVVGAAWITTGLVGVGALVTGVLAVAAASDAADDTYLGPAREPPPGSAIAGKIERADTFATAADVLITVGSVVGAAAITFSVVNAVGSEGAPTVSLGPGWIGATWRFR
jgi:hypothetical protein